MTTLYAQPYDLAATGFYFDSVKAYTGQASRLTDAYGQPVEEFEIQFIDGETLDCELFNALGVNQAIIGAYFDAVEEWSDEQKTKVIIAVGEAGYQFGLGRDDPDALEIDLYEVESLRELAIQFVDECVLGEIPAALENYIDYDAFARDLSVDYGTVSVGGVHYAYRSA